MNFKKWTSAITLCAITLMASVSPVLADDTASVDTPTPNFYSVAQAMNAAQISDSNNGSADNNNSPEQSGTEYVTLDKSAASDQSGNIYLPLRATFQGMKDQALQVAWKPNGQEKIVLSGTQGTFEVYVTAGDTGLQLTKGGTTYPLISVDGETYAAIEFFQAIIGSANIGVSDTIIILSAKQGNDVWNAAGGFWTGMSSYQEDVVEPEQPTTPTKPDITYPDINKPSNNNNSNNSNNTNNNNSNNGGSTTIASNSVVPIKVVSGGNGLIADALFWPTSVTYVSSPYAYRSDPFGGLIGDFHLGVDIAGPTGTPIYAAQGGTVIRASWFDSYGNCIDIQHPSGLVTRYAHLSAYNVSVGDTVSQGQVIAAMGATGNVTGAHLHFETRINGQTVDPANYLNLDLAK